MRRFRFTVDGAFKGLEVTLPATTREHCVITTTGILGHGSHARRWERENSPPHYIEFETGAYFRKCSSPVVWCDARMKLPTVVSACVASFRPGKSSAQARDGHKDSMRELMTRAVPCPGTQILVGHAQPCPGMPGHVPGHEPN